MAKSTKIRVMISSRCNDYFPAQGSDRVRLTDLRVEVKDELERAEMLGTRMYEVWIHEDANPSAEKDSWEECVRQARDCDIFLMLYNGHAGFKGKGELSSVGICEAEFQAAYASAPSKVTVVDIFDRDGAVRWESYHRNFQARMDRESIIGARPANVAALKQSIRRAVVVRTIELAQKGVLSARQGSGYLGPALDWKRLDYTLRAEKMVASLVGALSNDDGKETCEIVLDGKSILCRPAAIPDSLSVASAREFVGQPHLRDHSLAPALKRCHGGPVHVIACHRGITEAQAQRMLGFPNATIVAGPFGVYVLDPVQAIQLALLGNCSDDHATRLAVQRFMDWLPQSGQLPILVRTAKKRKEIVGLLAKSA